VPAGVTPGVGEAVRAEDPLGFTTEFFFDAEYAERLQQRYDLRRGAEPARLDHFNIVVPDVRAAYEYYSWMGFGLSETIEDDQTLYAAWMFRKQTVHDVAFTGGDGPRLHHLGFFAHESHQVLRICDILGSLHREGQIERGPGRHGVSNAFYVYLRDPDGHRIEIYTSDYFTGDPGHPVLRWSVRDPRRRDFWGHPVIPSWYTEASAVLDLDGRVRPLQQEKQIAEVTVGADGFIRLPSTRVHGGSHATPDRPRLAAVRLADRRQLRPDRARGRERTRPRADRPRTDGSRGSRAGTSRAGAGRAGTSRAGAGRSIGLPARVGGQRPSGSRLGPLASSRSTSATRSGFSLSPHSTSAGMPSWRAASLTTGRSMPRAWASASSRA
jgi:catechol 2,3-dioxygenase-like lactoylglutathione lyase family enzyme